MTSAADRTGTVEWFDRNKGFGFIEPNDGSPDVHVHAAALEWAGIKTLASGVRVAFDVHIGRRGQQTASNLKIIEEGKET
jgi:CspA family cold shock protein